MDVKDLNGIKKVEVEILNYIDEFCKKIGVFYWLDSGTLLGAVRHKGFIPWDDDIDIGMMRKDYNRFIEEFKKFNSKFYEIKENKRGSHRFIKIISKNRKLSYESQRHDIFVDIFPFDYYKKSEINFLNKFVELHKNRKKGLNNKLKDVFVEIRREIRKKILLKLKFNYSENKEYIGYGVDCDFRIQLNKKEDIFPLKEIEYEKQYFKVPNNYDKYLSLIYGDYMKFPPIEERQPSHFKFINFDLKENVQ